MPHGPCTIEAFTVSYNSGSVSALGISAEIMVSISSPFLNLLSSDKIIRRWQ
jgi:hypothetical protein